MKVEVISERQYKACRLFLATDLKLKEIASEVKISTTQLGHWLDTITTGDLARYEREVLNNET